MHIRATVLAAAALGLALAVGPGAWAAEPVGEPVKWDPERVTQYATELDQAVKVLRKEVHSVPMTNNIAQRQSQLELREDLRQISNSTGSLRRRLVAGEDREQTEATFRRIGTLRNDAAEHARRSVLPAPMMDALVHAGEIHNRMKPYYYGKR